MSEKQVLEEQNKHETAPMDALAVSRRWLLLGIGVCFNAVVGAAVAVPVIRYLLSPAKPDDAYNS